MNKNLASQQLLNQGIVCIKQGDREGAFKLFEQAAQVDPRNLEAWLWLAALTNDRDQSIFYLNQVLLIDPQNRTALEGLHALNQQHQRLLELQNHSNTGIGKQTIKLLYPFGQTGSPNTIYLSALSLQFTNRSQGPIKDALAQPDLVLLIQKKVKRLFRPPVISVDLVLEVMQRANLTWPESVAIINHIVGQTYKKGRKMVKDPIEEAVQFTLFLFMPMSLSLVVAAPYPYRVVLFLIWFTIFVSILAIWHYQNDQSKDNF